MFKKLQQHWGVNGVQVLLILVTFALGGSLCGFLGRKIIGVFAIENKPLWVIVYLVLVTITWPLCVLTISVPLGQFNFFRKYVMKLARKLGGKKNQPIHKEQLSITDSHMAKIAIFASGNGGNAAKIIGHFKSSTSVQIVLVVCNNPGAGVLQIAKQNHIPVLEIEKSRFFSGDAYLPELEKHRVNFIVLAGFLWKLPGILIKAYPKKIVNIHPALLPAYGGKGMYGRHVMEAVLEAKETKTGITIHYVDELYDHGEIIFQATCSIDPQETLGSLTQKIQALEHTHYPKLIESVLPNQR